MHPDLGTVAAANIDSAVTYYRNEAGPEVAVNFVDELDPGRQMPLANHWQRDTPAPVRLDRSCACHHQ